MFSSRVASMTTPPTVAAPLGAYAKGKIITTDNGRWGYSSGCVGLCDQTRELVSSEAGPQSDRALLNLKNVVEDNGFSLNDVIKTTVFLTDMGDFASINEVYASYFNGESHPARSCVAVKGLPKNAKFMIEAVLFKE